MHIVVSISYWPVVILIGLSLLATLYHLSVPVRTPWRRALPGALLALVGWLYVYVSSGWLYVALGLGTLATGLVAFLLWAARTGGWPFARRDG